VTRRPTPRRPAALAAALRLTAALPLAAALWLAGCGGASWDGVDEAVVRRVAEDAGRHDTGPVFAGLEGDLLLFAFLWAGLLAGFALGYFSRVLFVERADLPAGKAGGEGLRAE
jgi:cobalt/nickel transport protein